MKKLFLFLLLNINLLLFPLSSYSREDLGLSLNYDYFNKQNQIVASTFLTTRNFFGFEKVQLFNVSAGLRTYQDKSPDYIYHYTLYKGETSRAIINNEGLPLTPGYHPPLVWGYLYGITIVDIDKTQIENSLIRWLQIRGGLGIGRFDIFDVNELNINGIISLKFGISEINFGEYNFKHIKSNTEKRIGLESGLNFISDFSYNEVINLKSNLDYSLLLSDKVIHMLTGGIYLVYNLKIKEGYKDDFMNFFIGANYYYYFIENINKEFIKYEIGINYHFTTNILTRF